MRILNPSLAELDPHLPNEIATNSDVAEHWRGFEHALDQRIQQGRYRGLKKTTAP